VKLEAETKAGWLSNKPVQSKLMLALGLVVAVFTVGTIAALVAQEESDRTRALRVETYERIVALDRLTRAVVDQQLSLRGYVISVDDGFLDKHDDGREDFTRQLEALRERMHDNPQQLTRLSQVSALMDQYWDAVADPVLGWMERATTRGRAVAVVTSGQDGRYVDEMRRALEEMQVTEQEQLARRTRSAELSALRTRWVLLVVLVGGVLLGAFSILVARWQITTPLVRLSALMERLAGQDHGIQVPDQARRDEVGAIARALAVFKRMAQATASETWVKTGVAAVSARLHEARDYAQFAELVLDELAPRVDAPLARFYRFRPELQVLELVSKQGNSGQTGSRMVLKLGEGPAGYVARSRQAEVLAHHYPRATATGRPIDTAIVRPLIVGEQLLGVIELGRAGRPELKHELLLNELMPILALSFENLAGALALRQSEQELQKANEALREKSELAHHQATHDPLTGLPNRLLFMDRLEQAVERCRRSNGIFALCYVDIDGFKPVNDRHGHQAGDALLCAIGGRMLETLRRTDTVARIGGDEFVLLMTDPESAAQALAVAERLGRRLAEPYILNSPALPETLVVEISASIGFALFPDDARTDEALMKAADAAMYVAKQGGKNRTVRAEDLSTLAPVSSRA
jgi:diguanylate cyclase (GGDEF)-like protein